MQQQIKAISLWQPWASFMALGLKTMETRSWSTKYRGWLAIHAAKRATEATDLAIILDMLADNPDVQKALRKHPWLKDPGAFPKGAVLAITQLRSVKPTHVMSTSATIVERAVGNFTSGRYAWKTDSLITLDEPIPMRGHQGLWDAPELVQVLDQHRKLAKV